MCSVCREGPSITISFFHVHLALYILLCSFDGFVPIEPKAARRKRERAALQMRSSSTCSSRHRFDSPTGRWDSGNARDGGAGSDPNHPICARIMCVRVMIRSTARARVHGKRGAATHSTATHSTPQESQLLRLSFAWLRRRLSSDPHTSCSPSTGLSSSHTCSSGMCATLASQSLTPYDRRSRRASALPLLA